MFVSRRYISALSFIFWICLFLTAPSCEEPGAEAQPELEQIKQYLGNKPQELSRIRPTFLHEFGRHGHSLDRLDLAAQKEEIILLKDHFTQLSALAQPQDSLLKLQREAELWMISRKIEDEPFLLYKDPLNQTDGFHTRLIQSFHDQFVGTKEETEDYNARMKMVPRQIKEVISVLQARNEAGIRSPKMLLKEAKKQLEDFIELEITQNPLYRGLAIKLNQVDVTSLNLYQASDYLQVTELNLQQFILPAYKKLLIIVEELLAESTEEGIRPVDKAYYLHQLFKHNGKEIQPEILYEEGRKELDSLQQSILQLEEEIRATPPKAHPEAPRSRNKLEQIQIFASKMRKAREQMIGLFDSLPQKSPEIMAKPEYLLHNKMLRYEPASLDKIRKARVVVDFARWEKSSYYQQQSNLYRKIYPGTFTLDEGARDEASYISPDGFLAWKLGWQNYVLRLANQPLYLFAADNEVKLAYLKGQVELVAQMMLDLGLHAKNWSTQEAQQFLEKNMSLTRSERENLLRKSYSNPGALVAPWFGAREFQRLANYTQVRFAPQITIKTFHEKCLKNGPLPWVLLRQSIGLYENRNLAR